MTQHPANHTGGRLTHLNRHQEDRHDANEEERGGVDEAADHVLAQGLDDEGHEGVHLYCVCVCVCGGGGGLGGWDEKNEGQGNMTGQEDRSAPHSSFLHALPLSHPRYAQREIKRARPPFPPPPQRYTQLT